MSDLQRAWAKAKLSAAALGADGFDEMDEETAESDDFFPSGIYAGGASGRGGSGAMAVDDDSSSASSASSVSSTGTVIPSESQRLFARPQGWVILVGAPSHVSHLVLIDVTAYRAARASP